MTKMYSNGGSSKVRNSDLTTIDEGDIINNKLLEQAKRDGTISTKLDKVKQGAHIKGNPEYEKRVANGEHPSYITVSKMESQQIINKYSGSGKVHINENQFKEIVSTDKNFGVYVEKYTGKEFKTNRGTIHYSKYGAHIVPAKPED